MLATFAKVPLRATALAAGCVILQASAASAFSPASTFGGSDATSKTIKLETVSYSLDGLVQLLQQRGYSSVKFTETEGAFYGAEGCLGNEKLSMKVSRWGDVVNRRSIGSCAAATTGDVAPQNQELAGLLLSRGFTQVKFLDSTPPSLTIEACANGEKLKLVLNKFGDIRDASKVGACSAEEAPPAATGAKKLPGLFETQASKDQIKAVLSAQGYTEIAFTGRFFFRYKVQACRNGAQYRMVSNRFGEIRASQQVGQCAVIEADYPGRKKPQEFSFDVIRAKGTIAPEVCQQYFDWLLYENTVLFDKGSAKIRAESAALLNDLSYVSSRCTSASIEISGHTDSDGKDDYNQKLSEKRAQSVVAYLTKKGIDRDRLTAAGYGEVRPVLPNTSEENKQYNRRIEFIVRWE